MSTTKLTTTPTTSTTTSTTKSSTTTPEETTKSESTTSSPETTPQPTPSPTPAPTDDGIIRITDGNLTCVMLSFEGAFFLPDTNTSVAIQSNQSTIIENDCEQPIIQSGDIQIGFTFNYTTIADGNRNTAVWDIQSIQITRDGVYTADKLEGMQAHAGSSYSCITGFNTTLTGDNNQTSTLY